MNLQEYLLREKADSNLWWRLSCGIHLNLFEEAAEKLDTTERALINLQKDYDLNNCRTNKAEQKVIELADQLEYWRPHAIELEQKLSEIRAASRPKKEHFQKREMMNAAITKLKQSDDEGSRLVAEWVERQQARNVLRMIDQTCEKCGHGMGEDGCPYCLKQELTKAQGQILLYQTTINKIDDYFEYQNESIKDRQRVHGIFEWLTNKLKTLHDER
jgi:hypothetical protein